MLGAPSASRSGSEASEVKNSALGKVREPESMLVRSENKGTAEVLEGVTPCGCALQAEIDALKRREEVLVSYGNDV